jgi:hypothetical protein
MYRCYACDTPAQGACDCSEEKPKADEWGFVEEEYKLDIQSGIRVKIEPEKDYI